MGELYRLDFPNGKSYIGATTKTAAIRFKQHRSCANSGVGKAKGIYGAWREYGDPTLIVLAIIENDELAETENRAMKIFDTIFPKGYNFSLGGEGILCKSGWTWYKRKAINSRKEKVCATPENRFSVENWAKETMDKLAKDIPIFSKT